MPFYQRIIKLRNNNKCPQYDQIRIPLMGNVYPPIIIVKEILGKLMSLLHLHHKPFFNPHLNHTFISGHLVTLKVSPYVMI